MSAAGERYLRAGDRADAEVLRRVRELERAVEAVVVGERERRIAELRRACGKLLRLRGAVEERIGAVGVELYIRHTPVLHEHTFVWNRRRRTEPGYPSRGIPSSGVETCACSRRGIRPARRAA